MGSNVITRERLATISKLALPLTVVLGSNLVMGVIDLAMVGRLGNATIAAVALVGFLNMMVLACLGGLAPAVQGQVARARGEGSAKAGADALVGGLMLAVLFGVTLAAASYCLYPLFLSWASPSREVVRVGIAFGRVLSLATFGCGINIVVRGFWSGIERPKVYMLIGLGMDIANILINYALIFGHLHAPALGATGAAMGTVCAVYLGVAANGLLLVLRFRGTGQSVAVPRRQMMLTLAELGLPAALQEVLFSAGYLVFFTLLAKVGTEELAAANVLIRLTIFLVILSMALGMTSATLVSRSLGAGDIAGAAAWGWDIAKVGVAAISLMGLPMLLFPRLFLSIFLTDPHTLQMAIVPLQLTAGTTGIVSLIYIFAFTLFSVGDGNRVMLVSFGTQWLIFLPAVWLIGPHLHYGLLPIWIAHMGYGLLATFLITAIWMSGRWKSLGIEGAYRR